MSFIGTYADLRGYGVGEFLIEELAGRVSGSTEPRWKIVCQRCGCPQILPHSKIAPLVQGHASQCSLQCSNLACPLSRREHQAETFEQFRRRERRESEQAARAASEAQTVEEKAAAALRAEHAKFEALHREFREYFNHQLKTKTESHQILNFDRWRKLSPVTRQMILDKCRADPTAFWIFE